MHRRTFLTALGASAVAPAAIVAATGNFEVNMTNAEWRDMLSAKEYRVMRQMGTERAFSSRLNDVTADGQYHCKGCDQALYPSRTKYDSGTGWPSFWAPFAEAVKTKPDRGLLGTRTEVHCDRCGSHLGHIFSDGPEPTGKRHCLNGTSLVFYPQGGGRPISG